MNTRQRYHPTEYGRSQWSRLLEFALRRSDHFECVIPWPRPTAGPFDRTLWPPALEAWRRDVVARRASMCRWDRALEVPAEFVRVRLSPDLIGYIRSLGPPLQWRWALDRPEDPTFLAGDAVVLASDSRNGRIAVYADRSERDDLACAGVRLLEPLGAVAPPWPTP